MREDYIFSNMHIKHSILVNENGFFRQVPLPMIGMVYTFCCYEDAHVISSCEDLNYLLDELFSDDDDKKSSVYLSIESILDDRMIPDFDKSFHRERLTKEFHCLKSGFVHG